jgi:ankyrin repeat protein
MPLKVLTKLINVIVMPFLKFKLVASLLFILTTCFTSTAVAEDEADEKTKELHFYTAAKEGRLSQVKAMLSAGGNVNSKNSAGRTALMGAAYNGNRQIVKTLLVEGADPNQTDAQGKTALMMAVANVKLDVVSELIKAGADVTVEDNNKKTAMALAERTKNKKLIKLLESASE